MAKLKLLLYSTKAKPQLVKHNNGFNLNNLPKCNWELKEYEEIELNGKIVAECDYEVEEIDTMALSEHVYDDYYNDNIDRISKESGLTCKQISDYLGSTWDSEGYAIHIKNLHIFDEPRELRFYYQKYKGDKHLYNIEKAPRNMMIAIGKQGDVYGLISVTPQEACNILNHKQVVLIRKKVLREMLK